MTLEEIKSCCFFGHEDLVITEELYVSTALEVVYSAVSSCRVFYFSDEGPFDKICYKAVCAAMKLRPDLNIKRVFCRFGEKDTDGEALCFNGREYEDAVCITPTFEGEYDTALARAKALVDLSDGIILYADKRTDSIPYTVFEYAEEKGKPTLNICTQNTAA